MKKINSLNRGRNCIDQKVVTNKGSSGIIIDYQAGKYTRNPDGTQTCIYPCQLKIRFEDGYEDWYRKNKVEYGQFRNPYSPVFYNIGRLGKKYDVHHYLFKRWVGMIDRCYNESHKSYSYYGGRGVKVCYKWLTFENYVEDVEQIEGFNYELVKTGELELDKDTYGGLEYSKDKCIWINRDQNKVYGFEKRKWSD